jgi:hypothetical protein
MPVPMMLAMTMPEAVIKPMVRRGRGDFTKVRSVIAVTGEPIIAPLEAVWPIIDIRFRSNNSTLQRFRELSEAIPGITLKAA